MPQLSTSVDFLLAPTIRESDLPISDTWRKKAACRNVAGAPTNAPTMSPSTDDEGAAFDNPLGWFRDDDYTDKVWWHEFTPSEKQAIASNDLELTNFRKSFCVECPVISECLSDCIVREARAVENPKSPDEPGSGLDPLDPGIYGGLTQRERTLFREADNEQRQELDALHHELQEKFGFAAHAKAKELRDWFIAVGPGTKALAYKMIPDITAEYFVEPHVAESWLMADEREPKITKKFANGYTLSITEKLGRGGWQQEQELMATGVSEISDEEAETYKNPYGIKAQKRKMASDVFRAKSRSGRAETRQVRGEAYIRLTSFSRRSNALERV